MALVCLPPQAIKKLKESALKGKVEIAKLYGMSSKERRDFFSGEVGDELGKFINTEFEKAMVSKQQTAMLDWAKSVFTPKAREGAGYKTVLDKISNLQDMGVLNPESEKSFLEDLVSDKLGITVSPDEVKIIGQKAETIEKAAAKLGDAIGDPTRLADNLEFFAAKADMDKYLQSVNPSNKLQVATGTVGRGMMLFSVKSPLLNIGSNLEVGATEAIVRRVVGRGLKGADNQLAKDYIKMANTIYQKTGYDITRMMDLSDGGVSGERVLGDTTHAQGKGAVRKVGQVVEDVVFKQLMGAPDVAFAGVHFADSVNLGAASMAKGAKAQALMADAMRLNPLTEDGKILRAQAILDAQTATWTNATWGSKVSGGVRKILNDLSGDLRLGDFFEPFVKTPANVIATGADYAGVGIPKAVYKTFKAVKSGNLGDREVIQSITRDVARAGFGLATATMVVSAIKPEDFVGAYDPARAQYEQLRNSNTNSVRIGGKWISLDWFGPLAIPMTAQLYAKKYGNGKPADKAVQYGQGLMSGVLKLPGIQDVADTVANSTSKSKQTGEGVATSAKNYAVSQLYSRLVPSFISDIAKGTDQYQRKSGQGWDGVKTNIPGLRQQAPIKRNIFGDPLKSEGAASTILFGSRVKTDKDNPLLKEVAAVSKATGSNINFSDWQKTSASGVAQFKAKVGAKEFDTATISYGQTLKKNLQGIVSSGDYKNADDETKLAMINKADADAQKTVFEHYNFKPERKKSLLHR